MKINVEKAREAWEISDKDLERVFAGTNFGSDSPRQIITDTLFIISGGYSTGHTALVCCQELGLVGSNKINPRLTKKGQRYLYGIYKKHQAATQANKEALQSVLDSLICNWGVECEGKYTCTPKAYSEAVSKLEQLIGDGR